jgi:hypothetical protein
MVQWTTPFMIGITNDGLNSDIVGQCFLSATNRLTYTIPQSTQKNLGKQKMGAWTSAFTIGFTLACTSSTIYQPFLQLKDISFPNQP